MLVGKKTSFQVQDIHQNRSKRSIDYAIRQVKKSRLSSFVQKIYVYGSCARKEQSYTSDVDLFIEFAPDFDINTYKDELNDLRGHVSPTDLELPEIDLHVTVGTDWENSSMEYYKNIREEGINIWEGK